MTRDSRLVAESAEESSAPEQESTEEGEPEAAAEIVREVEEPRAEPGVVETQGKPMPQRVKRRCMRNMASTWSC